MRPYEDLVTEAATADVEGWGFGWLDGRASEERPPWRFSRLLAERLATARAALDIDTGGGEVVNEAPQLPPVMVVTESWAPNATRARELLGARGAQVVGTRADQGLPFADETFDLVTSRHPVRVSWPEIHRVLQPGGHYLAQHVGPGSTFELIERFRGPLPQDSYRDRDPYREADEAEAAGFTVETLRRTRCRMELYDIGAVVWLLRKCVWWVPDFSVERYDRTLRELDAQLRTGTPFVAHSTRHLLQLRR